MLLKRARQFIAALIVDNRRDPDNGNHRGDPDEPVSYRRGSSSGMVTPPEAKTGATVS